MVKKKLIVQYLMVYNAASTTHSLFAIQNDMVKT